MLWTVLVLMRFMIRDWGLGLGLGPRTWTLYLYRAVLDVCSSGASAMSGWMDGECGSSSFVFLGGVNCSAKGSHVFSRAGLGWVWNSRHGRLYAAVGSDSWTGRAASVAPRCSSFLVDLSVLRRIPGCTYFHGLWTEFGPLELGLKIHCRVRCSTFSACACVLVPE